MALIESREGLLVLKCKLYILYIFNGFVEMFNGEGVTQAWYRSLLMFDFFR